MDDTLVGTNCYVNSAINKGAFPLPLAHEVIYLTAHAQTFYGELNQMGQITQSTKDLSTCFLTEV